MLTVTLNSLKILLQMLNTLCDANVIATEPLNVDVGFLMICFIGHENVMRIVILFVSEVTDLNMVSDVFLSQSYKFNIIRKATLF